MVSFIDYFRRMSVEDSRRLEVVVAMIAADTDRGAILGTILGILPDLDIDELLHVVQRAAELRANSLESKPQEERAR